MAYFDPTVDGTLSFNWNVNYAHVAKTYVPYRLSSIFSGGGNNLHRLLECRCQASNVYTIRCENGDAAGHLHCTYMYAYGLYNPETWDQNFRLSVPGELQSGTQWPYKRLPSRGTWVMYNPGVGVNGIYSSEFGYIIASHNDYDYKPQTRLSGDNRRGIPQLSYDTKIKLDTYSNSNWIWSNGTIVTQYSYGYVVPTGEGVASRLSHVQGEPGIIQTRIMHFRYRSAEKGITYQPVCPLWCKPRTCVSSFPTINTSVFVQQLIYKLFLTTRDEEELLPHTF